jgi:hypothetical protein
MDHTFSGLRGIWAAAKSTFAGRYEDSDALAMLNEPTKPVHAYNPLVQINSGSKSRLKETLA